MAFGVALCVLAVAVVMALRAAFAAILWIYLFEKAFPDMSKRIEDEAKKK